MWRPQRARSRLTGKSRRTPMSSVGRRTGATSPSEGGLASSDQDGFTSTRRRVSSSEAGRRTAARWEASHGPRTALGLRRPQMRGSRSGKPGPESSSGACSTRPSGARPRTGHRMATTSRSMRSAGRPSTTPSRASPFISTRRRKRWTSGDPPGPTRETASHPRTWSDAPAL